MQRITLVLGVVAVMVVMLVALAAPAMANPKNGGHHNNGRHLGQVNKKLDHRGKDRPFVNRAIFNPGNLDFPPVI
jgi:hypothetical protein